MGKKILVLGGARSGKSRFAEQLAGQAGDAVLYLATALPIDGDMEARIEKHRASRPAHWATLERYSHMETLHQAPEFQNAETVLLDCATVMITNLMFELESDYDTISKTALETLEQQITRTFEALLAQFDSGSSKTLIIVSNEVGLGLVPAYKLGNYFRDIAGRVNQMLASAADDVYFLVSGIPMQIK